MVYYICDIVLRETHVERLVRGVSVATGLLTYSAANAYGLSIPSLMASSINDVGPYLFTAVGVALPLGVGAFVAFICTSLMKNNPMVGTRAILLISTFVFAMFTDVYATLAGSITTGQGKYGLPNSMFVLGLALYVIFKIDTKQMMTEVKERDVETISDLKDQLSQAS